MQRYPKSFPKDSLGLGDSQRASAKTGSVWPPSEDRHQQIALSSSEWSKTLGLASKTTQKETRIPALQENRGDHFERKRMKVILEIGAQ